MSLYQRQQYLSHPILNKAHVPGNIRILIGVIYLTLYLLSGVVPHQKNNNGL